MHRQKQIIFIFVLILMSLIFVYLSEHQGVQAQVCGDEVGCGSGEDGCSNLLMSTLPAVNVHVAGGWYVPAEDLGKHCGVKDCFPLLPFKCACGQPVGGRLCTANERDGL